MASAWWRTNSQQQSTKQHLLTPCVCLSSFVGVPPTLSFAACLVCLSIQLSRSRASLKAERISLIMSSAWEIKWDSWWTGPNQTRTRSQIMCPCCSNTLCPLGANNTETHNLFAVFVKGRFDEEGTQSEAQSVVSVSNTCLPAGGAGLQQTTTSYNQLVPVTVRSSYCICIWKPEHQWAKIVLAFKASERVRNKQTNKNCVEPSIKMTTSS